MEVDNAIVFFSSPPLFLIFFFARTITSFIYLHVLTKSSSAYQININLSFFKLSVLHLRVHEGVSISWRTKHY